MNAEYQAFVKEQVQKLQENYPSPVILNVNKWIYEELTRINIGLASSYTKDECIYLREAWLRRFLFLIKPHFTEHGLYPWVNDISIEYPEGMTLGQTLFENNKDCSIKLHKNLDDGLLVLRILMHELTHAVTPLEHMALDSHPKEFVQIGNILGLTEGPPAYLLPGPELDFKLEQLIYNDLGPYPT